MSTAPQDLVEFGARYRFPAGPGHSEEVRTLMRIPGPILEMRFGMVAVADPWAPELAPKYSLTSLGGGPQSTTVAAVPLSRGGGRGVAYRTVAAAIGDLDQVVTWQAALGEEEAQFHLDVDSGLGAYYEITDAELLQPLFEDDRRMQGIYNRALSELVVPIDIDGRTVASVFLVSGGSGLHPVWAGFDKDMSAIALVLDAGILEYGERVPMRESVRPES